MDTISVLHVDDSEDDAFIVKKMLEDRSSTIFDITWINNKSGALRELLINQYDILLLDEKIGNESGLDIAEELFCRKIKIPIVFLTSFDSDCLDQRLQTIGVFDLLNKSEINGKLLARSIKYAVSSFALQQQAIIHAIIDPIFNIVTRAVFLHDLDITLKKHASCVYCNSRFLLICFSFKDLNNIYKDIRVAHAFMGALDLFKKPYDVVGRVSENRFGIILNNKDISSLDKVTELFNSIENVFFSVSIISVESNIEIGEQKLLRVGISLLSQAESDSSNTTTILHDRVQNCILIG